jgi:hypothetical protein
MIPGICTAGVRRKKKGGVNGMSETLLGNPSAFPTMARVFSETWHDVSGGWKEISDLLLPWMPVPLFRSAAVIPCVENGLEKAKKGSHGPVAPCCQLPCLEFATSHRRPTLYVPEHGSKLRSEDLPEHHLGPRGASDQRARDQEASGRKTGRGYRTAEAHLGNLKTGL